ncbi:MAG: beta-ketoacyl-[acyl-carrier-protein] synthase family protein [Methylotenera sp.]|nr:beta-ketoacyl-[acyl-carrier-protein] synthase family protein [Oligoflexia bacterium]
MGSTGPSPDVLENHFKKTFEKDGPEGQMGTTVFKIMNHSVVANVASAIGFHGPTLAVSSACSTSSQAMILGWEHISTGLYDVVVCGGVDDLNYISTSVFDIVLAASRGYNDRPQIASRPFDSKRDGLVVSEGAAVVILESEAHLLARKCKPLAEMRGGCYHCNGSHMSHSDGNTMADVMKISLERAKLNASDIHYVNAPATATAHGDPEEAQAVHTVFGSSVPVSSLKGHFGHSLAACGALEAIASIKMMEKGVVINTRNLDSIDPACAGPLHVQELTSAKIDHVLGNNFAFGGMNTSLVLSKVR